VKNAKGEVESITEVARVSVALQQMIALKQCVHLFAKPPKFTSLRNGDIERFTRFKEYWTQRNASSALYLMAKSALSTGDGAIYFYMAEKELQYTTWSYKDGDMLIPVYKKDGVTLKSFVRRYSSVDNDGKNHDTIDIITDKTIERRRLDGGNWVPLDAPIAHGFHQIPVAYHRENDVAWGAGQDLIDKIERLLSDVRESNAYFAFGILFLSGDDVNILPPKTTQGKVITSRDKDADAKLLKSDDMSPALKFEFDRYSKELFRTTGTVIIDPEVLKGGDQSGAYIKNLYNDAIQYAMDAKPRWQNVLDSIVSIVKEGLGRESVETLDYKKLTVISEPDIYIPMNTAEEIQMVNQSKVAGTISIQTAAEKIELAAPDEMERLKKQAEEEAKKQAEEAAKRAEEATRQSGEVVKKDNDE
jgi:SPP1 family phage portal protein